MFQFTLPTSLDDLIRDHESINQLLFGESSTTNNLLIIYENILNIMLETHVNEFDMKDVHLEITKKVPIGCNTLPPPNVVILKPSDPSNCNDNVHAACEMYRDDLSLSGDDHLCIAYDQAIFGRLISYKEIHKNVQLLLG